jgi:alpha-tubulin suppressor-like RCC1 family protein
MQRAFYLTNRKLLCSRIVFRQSRFFHRAKILHNSDTLNVSEENQKKRAFLIWGSCDEGQLGMKHSHLVLSSPTRHQELENMNAFHVTVGLNHSIAFCGLSFMF